MSAPTKAVSVERRQAFVAKLLAPIPSREEQADTPEFRKTMVRDMLRSWEREMESVKRAEALHQFYALSDRPHISQRMIDAYTTVREMQRRQCLIPAPTAKELRWKKRLIPQTLQLPEVAAAIAADEKRLHKSEEI